ncbi:hypothetical protein [Cardinium endosymbiont of Philonthus spinipes]|uniref:hypothetical protein n=1 Tax=Cardinium endosymbiont of Philonthus spinipes TaxID=3077941 RepID=UPI00313B1F70
MNIKKYLVVLPFLASCSGVGQSNMGLTSSKKKKDINKEKPTKPPQKPEKEIGTGAYMIDGEIRVFENGIEYPKEAKKASETYQFDLFNKRVKRLNPEEEIETGIYMIDGKMMKFKNGLECWIEEEEKEPSGTYVVVDKSFDKIV